MIWFDGHSSNNLVPKEDEINEKGELAHDSRSAMNHESR